MGISFAAMVHVAEIELGKRWNWSKRTGRQCYGQRPTQRPLHQTRRSPRPVLSGPVTIPRSQPWAEAWKSAPEKTS